MSLREQAALFREATVIVGASGAAWTGMIFSEQPIIGLSWLPAEYKEFCSYSSLANLLGHHLKFIECVPDRMLMSTSDAYSESYTIDPQLFEKSLRSLIHGIQ
jgi:hypothetical protein